MSSSGGRVGENPPADAGDTGLVPCPGRSHMLRSKSAHAPQLLIKPACLRAKSPATEPLCVGPALTCREAHVPQLERHPSAGQKKPVCSNQKVKECVLKIGTLNQVTNLWPARGQ